MPIDAQLPGRTCMWLRKVVFMRSRSTRAALSIEDHVAYTATPMVATAAPYGKYLVGFSTAASKNLVGAGAAALERNVCVAV